MGYVLGVDLGTTYTAAAVNRDGRVQVADLGNRSAAIPSAVFLREDEQILTGDAANRRGLTEPDRIAREFKRRVGDTTPLFLGGAPHSAESLMGRLLRWVVDAVAEREGGRPDHVAVCHPANWGPYKTDLLHQAIRIADVGAATLLTEPQAAAIHYAAQERLEPGAIVAVFDLGGGTFDAAALRKTPEGWDLLGEPEGIERLGGVDFDAAVFAHVSRSLGGKLTELDAEDPNVQAAVARLREECVEAKEALSSDTEVTIPVFLPNVQADVRLTRAEFEAMVRPGLGDAIGALRRALRSAGVEPEHVHTILLVGGSSRIPLVAQLVSAEFGRPVAVDAHPKHAIALGAAIAAAQVAGGASLDATTVHHRPDLDAAIAAGGAGLLAGAAAASPAPVPESPAAPAEAASPPVEPPTQAPPPAQAAPPPAQPPTQAPPPAQAAPPPAQPPAQAAPPPAQPPTQAPPPAQAAPPPAQPPAQAAPPPAQPPAQAPSAVPPAQPPGQQPPPAVVAPGSGEPPPTARRGRGRLVAVLVVVLLLLVGAGVVYVLTQGDDPGDDVATTAQEQDPGATTGATDGGTGQVVDPCDPSGQLCLTGASFQGDDLVAEYQTDLALALPGRHAHFYLMPGTTEETSGVQAGVNAGEWRIWATPDIFANAARGPSDDAAYTRAEVEAAGGTRLCVILASPEHETTPGTGNCTDIPAG